MTLNKKKSNLRLFKDTREPCVKLYFILCIQLICLFDATLQIGFLLF